MESLSEWHLRDMLLAFEHYVKGRAEESYQFALEVYYMLLPHVTKEAGLKPPKLPDLLKDD